MEVADAIVQNNTLLRLNLQFDTLGPRVRVTDKLKRNLDTCKKKLFYVIRSIFLMFFFLVRQKRMESKQEKK